MSRPCLVCSLLSTSLLLANCGGKTDEQPEAEQDHESSNTTVAGSTNGDSGHSEPGVESVDASSEAYDASAAPTSLASEGATTTSSPPDPTTTDAVELDGGVVTSPPVIVDPPQPVCEGQCGNAVVDSCEICQPGGGFGVDPVEPGLPLQDLAAPPIDPVCTTVTESCDGELAPEQTCEAIGFSGGTLACSQVCRYDDAQCDSCVGNPETVVCRDDLAAGAAPSFVALATNATDLVAAWNEGCDVKVAWFDGALDAVRTSSLSGAGCVTATAGITLAPLSSSWLAEIGNKQFVLDSEGEVVSERNIAGSALFAASRAGDTPLVVRQVNYGLVTASLLDEAGAEVWTREVSDSVMEAHYGSATAVSDGFLVALRTDAGVQVFHLDETSGTILDVSTPGSASTEYPQVHASGDEVRLVWADFGETIGVRWATLNEKGERSGEVVEIGASPDFFNRSPIVVDGDDTVVVFGGYTGGTGIGQATHVRRLDATGTKTAGDVAVQSDPNLVQWPQVVAFDGAFVTAWVGKGDAGRVGLARVEL
jgi:hypothetical protein